MIFHILKSLVSFILPIFYKRTQAKNIGYLNVNAPVIIAMNHPNAFTDPIYLTHLAYPIRLNYLARGDAFKPGFASYMLEKIGIIPIFRLRDGGKEGLKKNDETYRIVNKLLSRNGKIMVFAEGLCIQERRLRPLKKGVARMVFGAYEAIKSENLMVIPVGVNYSAPDRFRSNLFYNIGEPIFVKDFMAEYTENAAKAQNKFLQVLEPKMKELITHIKDPNDDEVLVQIETLLKNDLLIKKGMNPRNLEHDFSVLHELTEKINRMSEQQPELLKQIKLEAKLYFESLQKNKLRDWLLDPLYSSKLSYFHLSLRTFLIALGFPLFAIGFLFNFLPMAASHLLTLKIIKFKEFYSSFVIGIAMVLFWINYILLFFLIDAFSPNKLWPLFLCLAVVLCGLFCLHYYPFVKKTFGIQRLLKNKSLRTKLQQQRENLISLINKF